MGINIEFNPDLTLRNISEYKSGRKKIEECLPENIQTGKIYDFLKSGQRLFWLNDDEFWGNGQLPLCETDGQAHLSRPLASIKILEVTHFLNQGKVWTKGRYKVIEIFNPKDSRVHFEGYKRIK